MKVLDQCSSTGVGCACVCTQRPLPSSTSRNCCSAALKFMEGKFFIPKITQRTDSVGRGEAEGSGKATKSNKVLGPYRSKAVNEI